MMSIMQVAPEQRAFQTKEEPVRNSYIYNSEEFVMQEYGEEQDVEEGEKEVGDEGGEEVVEEVEEEVEEEILEEEYTEHEEYSEHAELAAGEDMTLYTEVTESETRTLQTITHADGSQTVTETVTFGSPGVSITPRNWHDLSRVSITNAAVPNCFFL